MRWGEQVERNRRRDLRLDPRRAQFDEAAWKERRRVERRSTRFTLLCLAAVMVSAGSWVVWTAVHGRAAAVLGVVMLLLAVAFDLWILLRSGGRSGE